MSTTYGHTPAGRRASPKRPTDDVLGATSTNHGDINPARSSIPMTSTMTQIARFGIDASDDGAG